MLQNYTFQTKRPNKSTKKGLTGKNLCQFCWLALKQKPQKPHFWDRNSSEFLTLSAIILLVCEHPDSLITNIVTLSGISISSWKNPAFGGKTVKAECIVKIAFELCWTDGAASTESSLFELCRVVTEVDDHQCASCFAETEKPLRLKLKDVSEAVKYIVWFFRPALSSGRGYLPLSVRRP